MFFVKEKIGNTTINVEITDENIFTVCPKCHREHYLDLEDLYCALGDDVDDGICCDDCASKGKLSIYRKEARYDKA